MRVDSRILTLFLAAFPGVAAALDRVATDTATFAAALNAAQPGDNILLAPGDYAGGHYRQGLSQVTIRSQNPQQPARIIGGTNGIQLSDATSVLIENLIFQQQTGNGVNIDDGGSFGTPSTDITIRKVTVADMQSAGNSDGIKLSGVTGFLLDEVHVSNWGAGGSAVDPVGSHHGLIQNSTFISTVATGGSGIRPKGGSKDITIRGNLISLSTGQGRAVQAGGSTGSQFFRFIDGDSGYEAAEITVEGNTILGGSSAISWVNIDGGVFHHNVIQNPKDWAFRILNENPGDTIIDTQNGVMADNVVRYSGDTWRRAGNYDGAEVLEETFTFNGNHWINLNNPTPAGSTPQLPTPEINGSYGGDSASTVEQHVWQFAWGRWLVAPGPKGDGSAQGTIVNEWQELLLATPGANASFDPSASDPLAGDWSFQPLASSTVQHTSLNRKQIVLIRPTASVLVPSIAGDYDRSGVVDQADYLLWRQQYGATGSPLADGNRDGAVNAADYSVWRDALPAAEQPSHAPVPTPTSQGVLPAFFGLRSVSEHFFRRRR